MLREGFSPPECHVSHVTCHMSYEIVFFFFFLTKWSSSLVEGLLSTGPNLSSFQMNRHT